MRRVAFVILFCLSSVFNYAQSIDYYRIRQMFEEYFGFSGLKFTYPVVIGADTLAFFNIYKNGYLVLSTKKEYYPLKAYSLDASVDTASDGFKKLIEILKTDYAQQKKLIAVKSDLAKKNANLWETVYSNFSIKGTVGPLLKSEYGQVNCKDDAGNYIYVTNYYTPNHYAVGCVALALTEVLRYYNWPIHGEGYYSYTDNLGSSNGTYSADFGNTTYKWSNILDKYYNVSSTEVNREALGRVAFDAAVSVEMDFESGGSTSNINRVPTAASKFFRYDKPLYMRSTESGFWDKIDSSLLSYSPVQLAVYTSSGAGHAVVCDGVQFTDDSQTQLYHLNMGWWGSSNGWYTIQSDFNAGGYSVVTAAVMGMHPVPEMTEPKYDLFTNSVKIAWYYSPKVQEPNFVLEYRHDGEDWQILADNITDYSYEYPSESGEKVYFRVKHKDNVSWSNEVYINTAKELASLDSAAVFPVPVTNYVNIRYKDLSNASFYIYNQSGKVVFSKEIHSDAYQARIDLPNLPSGLYLGMLKTPDYTQSIKLIITGTNIN